MSSQIISEPLDRCFFYLLCEIAEERIESIHAQRVEGTPILFVVGRGLQVAYGR